MVTEGEAQDMGIRARAAVLAVAIAALCAVVGLAQPARAQEPEDIRMCRNADVFSPAVERSIAAVAEGRPYSAAVLDTATQCMYRLRPRTRLTTASSIKATVAAAVLSDAQETGRSLTAQEERDIRAMLRRSHDRPTARLYVSVGISGMEDYTRSVGADDIAHDWWYGATVARAADLTRVAASLLHESGPGPLEDRWRRYAWSIMSTVHPTQRFGISAGVPRGFEVALKNGFYPCSDRCPIPAGIGDRHRWRVSSTGFVRQGGSAHGWAVTILTDGNATQEDGVELTETISGHIAAALYGPKPAPRPYDRAVCVTATGDSTRRSVLSDLGLPDTRRQWRQVLSVSGGHPMLDGQLMCAPGLAPRPPR